MQAIYIYPTQDHNRTMKTIISAAAFAVAMTAALSFGAEDPHAKCCVEAKKAGKECAHPCCVQANKDGKVCEKCTPAKDDKKPS